MKNKTYRCVAVSIEGLIQQVTLSYLRHGYFHYVTGSLRPKQTPEAMDESILEKYAIRKCWRYRADQKARGFANLQYIRHGDFYVIMATEGEHRFKKWERHHLRDIRKTPLHVPISSAPREFPKNRKKQNFKEELRTFEGYEVAYRRGRFERKTADERAEYKKAIEDWKRNKLAGKQLPKPPKGKVNIKWHPTVAIEPSSFERLHAYFMAYATKWDADKLAIEFNSVPYAPYWKVKRQLFEILSDVNAARKAAAKQQLPYKVVHSMKRQQVFPFGKQSAEGEVAA